MRTAGTRSPGRLSGLLLAGGLCVTATAPVLSAQQAASRSGSSHPDGRPIYEAACAPCHGEDARGASKTLVGFEQPLPDLTDPNFTREPDADWFAIVHEGGPVRAFNRLMPAFGDALAPNEIQAVIDHVRSLGAHAGWPRGELNFPRAILTEKAFPEDEAMFVAGVAAEGAGEVANKLIYEKRFGARNQFEVIVPFSSRDDGVDGWTSGIGDLAFGAKRVVYHDRGRGTIVSLAGEVSLPTGNADRGFGSGHVAVESFAAFGQALPRDAFVQAQAGVGIPTNGAARDAFWRLVAGRSYSQGEFGRTWSPMVELAAARDLIAGEAAQWDVVPQVQVTLSRRQHIMAAVGARVPLTDRGPRRTQVVMYFLWDWFDGGLLEAWK